MKRTLSILFILVLIIGICALFSCDYNKDAENVSKIEAIIKEGMIKNDGRYFIGAPYGNMHYAEIKRCGGSDKIDIAIFTPYYQSHIICAEDFEIYVADELTPYCQKLYFEYEETTFGNYWEMSDSIPEGMHGSITFLTGKLYYISPETGEKYELDLK